MKITKSYLREVIKEELERMDEALNPIPVSWRTVIDAYNQVGKSDAANYITGQMQQYNNTLQDMLHYVNGKLYHSYSDHVKQYFMDVKDKNVRNILEKY